MSKRNGQHKFGIGMVCRVINKDNRQAQYEGIKVGTLCRIVKYDTVFSADDAKFPGYVNYLVHFLPENKYAKLNETGPFLFEHDMEPTLAGKVLF